MNEGVIISLKKGTIVGGFKVIVNSIKKNSSEIIAVVLF